MKERLQVYYDPAVDIQVKELIETFEDTGKGKRGYTTDKIKECLKVYQVLAERCGTSEPMDVLLHYIDGAETSRIPRTENRGLGNKGLPREEDRGLGIDRAENKKVSEEVDSGVANLIDGDGGFEFGENV